jgi:glycosyltransferase involved in cell wall biosynthesis
MKIVLLARSLDFGGAERQLVLLARGLHERGHRVDVVVFYAGAKLEDELKRMGIPVHDLRKRGRWDTIGFLYRAYRLVRRLRPRVLHAYLIAPNLVSVLLKVLLPDLRIVWGVRASNMDLRHYDRFSRVTFRAGCLLSGIADRILVNSNAGLEYHRRHGYPSARMRVIPNGIDTDRFRPSGDARRHTRAEWGVGHNQRIIGLAARLDPMKDHDNFLEAARMLAGERGDVRFVCVGDGPPDYRRALRRAGEPLENVGKLRWEPARADMAQVLNGFDVATSSSRFGEGFSNAIGEAMACGVPCVVTDVGDSAKIVGPLGRVVPPSDPARLAAGWRETLDRHPGNPRQDVRERIVRRYSVRALVERTEAELIALGEAGG